MPELPEQAGPVTAVDPAARVIENEDDAPALTTPHHPGFVSPTGSESPLSQIAPELEEEFAQWSAQNTAANVAMAGGTAGTQQGVYMFNHPLDQYYLANANLERGRRGPLWIRFPAYEYDSNAPKPTIDQQFWMAPYLPRDEEDPSGKPVANELFEAAGFKAPVQKTATNLTKSEWIDMVSRRLPDGASAVVMEEMDRIMGDSVAFWGEVYKREHGHQKFKYKLSELVVFMKKTCFTREHRTRWEAVMQRLFPAEIDYDVKHYILYAWLTCCKHRMLDNLRV